MVPLKKTLQAVNPGAYTFHVAETKAAGFGDLSNRSAQPRRAAFLCVSPSCASFNGRALAGRPSGLPVPSVAGSPTPSCARSPHLAMGSGLTANRRGRIMLRHIPARPEQTTLPNTLTAKHPLFAHAGRNAAELWLVGAPLSMADFRDLRFRNLVAGDTVFAGDVARRKAFNDAFAREIALSIARQSRAEVRHD
jgi:hypothetical protein